MTFTIPANKACLSLMLLFASLMVFTETLHFPDTAGFPIVGKNMEQYKQKVTYEQLLKVNFSLWQLTFVSGKGVI